MTKKKDPSEYEKQGRPTKFNEAMAEKAFKLARRGMTDLEIAEILDVNESTIYEWKNKHPDFSKALNLWKEDADNQIERSYFELARGYKCIETKVNFDKDACYLDDQKNPRPPEPGEPDPRFALIDVIKCYPPNEKACSRWLFNRRAKDWKPDTKLEIETNGGTTIVNVVMDDGHDDDDEAEE
jgi:hypothetical protein